MNDFNTDLVRSALGLTGEFTGDASALGQRLIDSVSADELTIGLVDRLRDAERSATDLLGRAASVPVGPAPSPTPPEPLPADPVERRQVARHSAEHQLEALQSKLRAEAGLALTWQITDVDDADG